MRNSFLTPLKVQVMEGGKTFKLTYPFTYVWKSLGGKVKIQVPIGFVTDFASIPRFARIIIPKLGRFTKSSVVHDYLYQHGSLTRKQADLCFRDGMKELGVSKFRYTAMYIAVRVFGSFAWKRR